MTNDSGRKIESRPNTWPTNAGRSWLEALQAARMGTERKREAHAQLREAWDLHEDD